MSISILRLEINWLIPFVNTYKLVFNELIVGRILVLEFVDVVEYLLYFLDILCFVPEKPLRSFQASCLNIFDLFHCVLLDFSPNKFFFKEI